MRRAITVLSALAGLVTLLLTLGGTPAGASVSAGYIGGAGTITDDWGDEGPVSQSSHSYSSATGLWQWVLYADGATETNGTPFDPADVDCHFGPNTAAATRNWQSRHNVGVDATVGPQTFGAADGHLRVFEDLSVPGNEEIEINYVGSAHTVRFRRLNGEYEYRPPGATVQISAIYGTPTGASGTDCLN